MVPGLKDFTKKASNKYVRLTQQVISDDEVIVKTNNIITYCAKNSGDVKAVLVTNENQGVYLASWNWAKVQNGEGIEYYVVRLNRKFFKKYTFKTPFEDFDEDINYSFDDLAKIAQEQQDNQDEMEKIKVIYSAF